MSWDQTLTQLFGSDMCLQVQAEMPKLTRKAKVSGTLAHNELSAIPQELSTSCAASGKAWLIH